MNEIIDLTHIFTDDMPVYPGDPCSKLYQCATIQKDGFTDHKIESCLHVGTHMDAPFHMVEGGAVISDFPAGIFQGRGVLIDARGAMRIDERFLENTDIQSGDIVLVRTDWCKKYRTEAYYKEWPIFTEGFAKALAERKIALLGMDTPGPDMDETFPVHKILLPRNILIIENITNLAALESIPRFKVHAYPARYKADAAPVRVVAEVIS
jgi:kynurenine formamidase